MARSLLDAIRTMFNKRYESDRGQSTVPPEYQALEVEANRLQGPDLSPNDLPDRLSTQEAAQLYRQRNKATPTSSPYPTPGTKPTPFPRASGGKVTLDSFMTALSGQESGGNYAARNSRTGASGKYQILPSNWPSWSKEAGLPAGSAPTPKNQEYVARFKIQQYYNKYGNWEDVASAWYSGRPLSAIRNPNTKQGAGNEPSINEYVQSVLRRAGR